MVIREMTEVAATEGEEDNSYPLIGKVLRFLNKFLIKFRGFYVACVVKFNLIYHYSLRDLLMVGIAALNRAI